MFIIKNWFGLKIKKLKKSDLVFCFTCTLLLLASVLTNGSEIIHISRKKGFSQKECFFPSSYIIPKLQWRNEQKTLI